MNLRDYLMNNIDAQEQFIPSEIEKLKNRVSKLENILSNLITIYEITGKKDQL